MNVRKYLAYRSRKVALEAAVGAVTERVAGPALRRRLPPNLRDLADAAGGLHTDLHDLFGKEPWATKVAGENGIEALTDEYSTAAERLRLRYQQVDLPLPSRWAVESGTSLLLYVL